VESTNTMIMRTSASGFTLVELMITVAILVIIALVAVPSYNNYIANERARTATTGLSTAFAQARSEAIKSRQVVSVCGSNAAGTACNNATDWSAGWLVVDGAGVVLGSFAPPGGTPGITASGNVINFRNTGETNAAFNVAVSVSGQNRCVRVLVSGLTHSATGGC